MIAVTLHNNKRLLKKQQTHLVPEQWDELTGDQLAGIAHVLLPDDDPQVRRVKLLAILMKMEIIALRRMSRSEVMHKLLPLVDWITEDCTLTRQLLPSFRVGRQDWYGPYDDINNMVLVEFAFAERALYEWHLARNEGKDGIKELYYFLAILYRPMRPQYDLRMDVAGDPREPFNGNVTLRYADILQQYVPLPYAEAALLFYKGCRKSIVAKFPRIFGDTDNEVDDTTAEAPAYFGLMRRIAEKGTYGDFGSVETLYIYTAFMEMDHAIQDREALEAELEKRKTAH